MSNTFNDEVQLFPGDTVQLEGGLFMVEAVGSKTADCLPLAGGKLREHAATIAKNLIIKRGGQAALDEFKAATLVSVLTKPVKLKKGMVRLELGDKLCHGHEQRTVVAVADRTATLGNLDGAEFQENRVVSEFLFTDCQSSAVYRLDESERAAHLKNFLAQRKPPLAGTNNETRGVKETEVMATKKKTKAVKTKVEKKRLEKSKVKQISYAGRGEFTFKLVKAGNSDNEILDALKEKYGVNTGSHGPKIIESQRRKLAKQEAK